jgi:hypothetical protein
MKYTFIAPLNANTIAPHTTQLNDTAANSNGTTFLNNLKSYIYIYIVR